MDSFNLKIVSFEKVLLNKPVLYCAIYTETGKIGFEARHETFVSTLKEGSRIEYRDESGKEDSLQVKNGLFLFKDNSCIITVFIGE